jgi:alcohol dehydrogenase
MDTMKAAVYRGSGQLVLEDRPKPVPGPGEAVIRITTTSICSTDVRILRGELLHVPRNVVLGHEPVGVIDALGPGLEDEFAVGDRVVAGAITPCGQCYECLSGALAQCGGTSGGWRFGRTIDGTWAEYLLVPHARANLAKIPPGLADRDVLPVTHVFSSGLAGAEPVQVGDTVVIFGQGPVGLCATAGAGLRGAALVVAVDVLEDRLRRARRFGATVTVNARDTDPLERVRQLTGGRGADVAIEAVGRQETFEAALRALRPGGILSSLGVYAGKLVAPIDGLSAGLGDKRLVTTLCPGGKERMRRLLALVATHRVDLGSLVTHEFTLDDLAEAIALVAERRDGVLKVALHPAVRDRDRLLEAARIPVTLDDEA